MVGILAEVLRIHGNIGLQDAFDLVGKKASAKIGVAVGQVWAVVRKCLLGQGNRHVMGPPKQDGQEV